MRLPPATLRRATAFGVQPTTWDLVSHACYAASRRGNRRSCRRHAPGTVEPTLHLAAEPFVCRTTGFRHRDGSAHRNCKITACAEETVEPMEVNMAAAIKTTDHDEIRRWVERHGGHPATVKRTRTNRDVGMIRIDFPGFSGEKSLDAIGWDEWFDKFDQQQLAFLYQEGKNTNFNKLVRRDPDRVRPSDRTRGPSRTTGGGRAAARALSAERRRQPAQKPRRASSSRPAATARSKGDLRQSSKSDLYQRARAAGVPRRSSMSKAELVRALERRQGG
jgi:hypothetical protein